MKQDTMIKVLDNIAIDNDNEYIAKGNNIAINDVKYLILCTSTRLNLYKSYNIKVKSIETLQHFYKLITRLIKQDLQKQYSYKKDYSNIDRYKYSDFYKGKVQGYREAIKLLKILSM